MEDVASGGKGGSEKQPLMQHQAWGTSGPPSHMVMLEHSPAYEALLRLNLLTDSYRVNSVDDLDIRKPDTTSGKNLMRWLRYNVLGVCFPFLSCCVYQCLWKEYTVPAGHVLRLRDEEGGYFMAGPGMHAIQNMYVRSEGKPASLTGTVTHGDMCIVTVEQGYVGLAFDRGQPILLPPGLHQWKSHTLAFERMIDLQDHVIPMGPYTLLTVDEGYAAVTQNNGKQKIVQGGSVQLLDHKNWKFEKFMTMKIQTDNLDQIEATSADNIIMMVTSTVCWRIVDVECAATRAAETMAASGKQGEVSADIGKLRDDVLKQAIASLSSFIASVNYSDSFHLAAAAQASAGSVEGLPAVAGAGGKGKAHDNSRDNPMFDVYRMKSAVEHANFVTTQYGIEIMSINIISANPVDKNLTRALASGAVAAAEALQAETAARGQAKATRIEAVAAGDALTIQATSEAETILIKANAEAEATRLKAAAQRDAGALLESSDVATSLAKINASAEALGEKDKFFFGQGPEYMQNMLMSKLDK